MNKRWQVSEDNVSYVLEVSPINGAKVTFDDERDLDAGQIFFRRKIGSDLSFAGADYRYFKTFENQASRRCRTLYIRLQLQCGNVWQTFWTGQFSTGSGKWDLDKCIFDVKPETVDKYTCILKDAETKRNVLEAPSVLTLLSGGPGLEFYGCSYLDGDSPCAAPSGTGWSFVDDYVAPTGVGDPTELVRVWVRKKIRLLCVEGVATPPEPSGWTLLSDDCATDGTSTYVKAMSGAEVTDLHAAVGSPNLYQGTCTGGVEVQPANPFPSVQSVFVLILPCTDPNWPSLWLILNTGPSYNELSDLFGGGMTRTGRTGRSVMDLFIDASECSDVLGVKSDFLEWSPPGTAPGYVAGENYVTGAASQTAGLVLVQKSDAILPNATNPATRGELSMSEFFTALRVIYRLFWDIDANGYIRIEHWSYWTSVAGIDIREMPGVNEPLQYEHTNSKIPRYERAKWMESNGEDFNGLDIIYDSQCASDSDKDSKVENISPGQITTDVGMIADPELVGKISRDGFVWLACDYANGTYSTIVDIGELSGDYVLNAPLSWANLQRDFWTWDRKLASGNMNGVDVVFDGFVPNIEQADVLAPICCQILTLDPQDTISTKMGDRLNADAVCSSITHDLHNDRTTFKFTYAY